MVRICFTHKNKKIILEAKKCNGINRGIGLMFKPRSTDALVFNFNNPTRMAIHSCFVFFPFIAVWTDEKGKVLEVRKVEPFTLTAKPKDSYKKLIEIPINEKYDEILKLLDGN